MPKTLEEGLLTTKVDSPSQLAASQQDMLEIRQWDLFEAQSSVGGIRLTQEHCSSGRQRERAGTKNSDSRKRMDMQRKKNYYLNFTDHQVSLIFSFSITFLNN